MINKLKIDTLVFGSESNDLTKLEKIVDTQLNNPQYNILIKQYIEQGINYPTAASKALTTILGYTISEPNDLLGISYIKEIRKNNYQITPFSIKRIGNYHEKEVTNKIISASLIRNLLQEKKNIQPHVPKNLEKYLYKTITLDSYFPYLKYKILTSKNLSIYQTVEEGIENRIIKFINNANNWEELVQQIKTKRYTHNKINRMLIHILTSFTKEEAKNLKIDYIRILGFNKNGRNYLNKIKKEINIPLITRYKKNISQLLDLEMRITSIYYLPINSELTKLEYKKTPIIYNPITDDTH